MMVILERRSRSPKPAIFMPSMKMAPSADSMIRKRASIREDLPAPVRPTIPILAKGGEGREGDRGEGGEGGDKEMKEVEDVLQACMHAS